MNHKIPEQLLLSEVQVLLAEKRTYFAILRTGLAVIAVPLTVIGFLVATAEYHSVFIYPWLATTVISILIILSVFGAYLVYRSSRKIRLLNKRVIDIEKQDKRVDAIIV